MRANRSVSMLRILISVVILILSPSIYSQNIQAVKDLYDKGIQHFQNGNYDESIAEFTQAIKLTSTLKPNPTSLRNDFSSASIEESTLADRVGVVDDRTPVLLLNRGNVFFIKGDMDRAIDDYTKALAISPGMLEAYHCRGTAWLMKKDY